MERDIIEFQKKKEEEQVQHLISSGIVLPPGLPHHLVLSKFPAVPPPGEGPYTATKLPAAFTTSTVSSGTGLSGLEGKSETPAISSSNTSNPSTNPTFNSNATSTTTSNPNPNFTSNSTATSNATSNAAVKSVFFVVGADWVGKLKWLLRQV